jgi:hypothetical protein
VILRRVPNAEVELIFGNLDLISISLAAVGVLIIFSGIVEQKHERSEAEMRGRAKQDWDIASRRPPISPSAQLFSSASPSTTLSRQASSVSASQRSPLSRSFASGHSRGAGPPAVRVRAAMWIGAVQGLCLPFRGFSRSGATISTGLLLGLPKRKVEEFSFALVVILTPPVILKEVHRLLAHHASSLNAITGSGTVTGQSLIHLFLPSLIGMAASFVAGLLALRWLSSWLEKGKWKYFGYYCLAASIMAFLLYRQGI